MRSSSSSSGGRSGPTKSALPLPLASAGRNSLGMWPKPPSSCGPCSRKKSSLGPGPNCSGMVWSSERLRCGAAGRKEGRAGGGGREGGGGSGVDLWGDFSRH